MQTFIIIAACCLITALFFVARWALFQITGFYRQCCLLAGSQLDIFLITLGWVLSVVLFLLVMVVVEWGVLSYGQYLLLTLNY